MKFITAALHQHEDVAKFTNFSLPAGWFTVKFITTALHQHKGVAKFTDLSLPAGWFTVKLITTALHQHKGVAKFTDLSPFVKFITTTKIRPALGNSLSSSRGAGRTTGCTICLSGQKFCIIYFLPSPVLPPLVMHVW